jgi:hypothetical protein
MLISKRIQYFILFCFCILLLSGASLLRNIHNTSTFYGAESAYTSRIIEGYTSYDTVQLRVIPFNLYFFLLGQLHVSTSFIMHIVPYLLGILSLVFFALLVKNESHGFLMLILLITSPLFIYLFSTLSYLSLVVFLTILGFYLFMKEKSWLACIPLIIIPLIDLFAAMIVLALFFCYAWYKKEKLRDFYIIFITLLLPSIYIIATNTITLNTYFAPINLNDTFAEFGALPGLTAPLFILSLIGIVLIWKKPKERFYAYLLFIILFITSLLSSTINVFFSFLLPFCSAYALNYFWERKWSIPILKNITFILIACSLLFPAIIFYDEVTNQAPNNDMIATLAFLKDQPQGIVFSSPENGFFIEQYARMPTFMDRLSPHYPYFSKKMDETQFLLYSRTLANTTSVLDENNIVYFYIDGSMKESYWNNQEEGLLFLLRNNDQFKLLKRTGSIELYRYIKS